jgi:glucose-1-phosphate thymidylyltransferase
VAGVVGVVPAAGIGARLSTYRGAKELIQVGYRAADGRLLPMAAIEHVLTAMHSGGVDNAFVVLSPAKQDVFRYLGSGRHLGLELGYLCQETALGMPQAIDLATPFLAGRTVCLGMPDTIVSPGDCYAQLLDFHDACRADVSLGVFPTTEPQSLAPVVIEPGSHRVLAILDKPKIPPVANTWGIAAWSPRFTGLLHDFVAAALHEDGSEMLLSDAFGAAMTAGLRVRALAFESGEYHDIGTPAGVVRTRERLESARNLYAGGHA